MPVAELDGHRDRLRAGGRGPTLGADAGRAVHQGGRRAPRDGPGAGRPRPVGADLGPPELRRVVGRVPRAVRVGGPGRCARRAPSPPRSRPDGDRRRLGRRAGVAAHRRPQPRRHRRVGDVVDQRRRARDCSSSPTTTACRRPTPRGTAAWRPSSSSTSGRRCWRANPGNRERFLSMDRQEFIDVMDRWMLAYCPCDDSLVPGLDDDDVARLAVPILVFRSGVSDMSHTRATSEALAAGLPGAELVEPPWGDDGVERASSGGGAGRFALRPLAAAGPATDRLGRSDDRRRIDDRTAREELTMTTITVRPIRDDLSFGARVGGVTLDQLGDPEVRSRLNEAFEERGLLIFEDVDPTPEMQVAISTVFGPLKDHPSTATPRVGGDMLGVIEIRHEPNEGGVVQAGWSAAVAVAALALRPLLQRSAQPGRRAPRRRDPAGRRHDRLRRRHRPLRRGLTRGAGPDRGRDGDLRDGRDPRQPPVRSARRLRRGRRRRPGPST